MAALLPAGALGFEDVLEAELLLGALGVLAADDTRGVAVTAGTETIGGSTGATAASLGLGVAISAATVGTETDDTVSTSTGASATGDEDVATSGAGAEKLRGPEVDRGWREVSTVDASDATGCDTTVCLGLTEYRTTAIAAVTPRSMVSVCSKAILALHQTDRRRRLVICGGVKGITQ